MVNAIQILQCHPATKSPGYLRHFEAQMICHCRRLVSSHSIDFIMIWIWGITSKCTSTHWPTVAIPTGVGMLCASHTEWSSHSHTYFIHSHTDPYTHTAMCSSPPLHAQIPTRTRAGQVSLSWTVEQRNPPAFTFALKDRRKVWVV